MASPAPATPTTSYDAARILLTACLSIYDSYHSQKETMAYTVVALYLTASALFFKGAFWLDYSWLRFCGLLIFLGTCAAIAVLAGQLAVHPVSRGRKRV